MNRQPCSNSELEVASYFDPHLEANEAYADLDWNEALADQWGIPYSKPKTVQPETRSTVHSVMGSLVSLLKRRLPQSNQVTESPS